MRELKEIGKPPRFFTDDMKTELECLCGPQPFQFSGERKVKCIVRFCPVHGQAADPNAWR
jgi:hypothetical protein